jgi:hypothetical protein
MDVPGDLLSKWEDVTSKTGVELSETHIYQPWPAAELQGR